LTSDPTTNDVRVVAFRPGFSSPEFVYLEFVWTNTRQQGLIDSLFKGSPIPAVVLAVKEQEGKKGKNFYTCIDGQQRLTTIKRFMSGKVRRAIALVGVHTLTSPSSQLAYSMPSISFLGPTFMSSRA
jgi:hypothetical protein